MSLFKLLLFAPWFSPVAVDYLAALSQRVEKTFNEESLLTEALAARYAERPSDRWSLVPLLVCVCMYVTTPFPPPPFLCRPGRSVLCTTLQSMPTAGRRRSGRKRLRAGLAFFPFSLVYFYFFLKKSSASIGPVTADPFPPFLCLSAEATPPGDNTDNTNDAGEGVCTSNQIAVCDLGIHPGNHTHIHSP